MQYREQSQQQLAKSMGLSIAVGLLSIVVNRWYRAIASFSLNGDLLLFAILLLFAACYYLDIFVQRSQTDKIFVSLDNQLLDISDLLTRSKQLVKGLKNMTAIFSLAAVIGLYLFLKYSILLGLAIAFADFLFSWFIINDLDLFKRYRAIKELDEEILI